MRDLLVSLCILLLFALSGCGALPFSANSDTTGSTATPISITVSATLQATLTQTFVANDHSFSFRYPADWDAPKVSQMDSGDSNITEVHFNISSGLVSIFFDHTKAPGNTGLSFQFGFRKQTPLKLNGRDALRLDDPIIPGDFGIDYEIDLGNGNIAWLTDTLSQANTPAQLDPTLQAIAASIQAPASSNISRAMINVYTLAVTWVLSRFSLTHLTFPPLNRGKTNRHAQPLRSV